MQKRKRNGPLVVRFVVGLRTGHPTAAEATRLGWRIDSDALLDKRIKTDMFLLSACPRLAIQVLRTPSRGLPGRITRTRALDDDWRVTPLVDRSIVQFGRICARRLLRYDTRRRVLPQRMILLGPSCDIGVALRVQQWRPRLLRLVFVIFINRLELVGTIVGRCCVR